MEHYLITVKGGHVGKHYYARVTFPIKANSLEEAIEKVIHLPRVKHERIDDILEIKLSNKTECCKQAKANNKNPYFHCTNSYETSLVWNEICHFIFPEKPSEWKEQNERFQRKGRTKKCGMNFRSRNSVWEEDEQYTEYCLQNIYSNEESDEKDSFTDEDTSILN